MLVDRTQDDAEKSAAPAMQRAVALPSTILPTLRYAVAVLAVGAATLLAMRLRPFSYATPFLFLYPAVVLAVWIGGLRPGLLATVLASLVANHFFLPPYGRFRLDAGNVARTVFFGLTFASICWLAELARSQLRESEKRWLTTLQSIGDAVISTDGAGCVTFMNQVAEELTGWPVQEAHGKNLDTVFEIINQNTRQKPENPVSKVIRLNKVVGLANHTVLIRRDRTEIPIDDSGAPIFGHHGKLEGVVLVFRDISARKQAEQELTAVYDNAPVMMVVLDGEHRVCKANKFAEEFAGAASASLVGRRGGEALRCLHALDDPGGCGFGPHCRDCAVRSTVLDTFATGQSHYQVEASLPFNIGGRAQNLTFLLSTARLNVRGQGQVLLTLQDITGRKGAEQALIRSEKLAATGRLAATIAHEINNPLEALTNLVYLVGQSITDTSTREYIALMEKQLQTISRITSQTLKFHRESGQPAEFSLAELIEELLQFYEPKAKKHGVTVVKRLDSEARVFGFISEIRQVISNLLLNAIEATPQDGRVTVHLYEATDWRNTDRRGYRVSVADTGIGIDSQHRSLLFEPFFTTKGENGTGLGLWVSMGIISRAGGSLRVWSTRRPGRSGTCFSIFLPAETACTLLDQPTLP